MDDHEFHKHQEIIISDEKHPYFGDSGTITRIDDDAISVQILAGPFIEVQPNQIEPYYERNHEL